MKKISIISCLALCFILSLCTYAQTWSQFRGPNCSGIAEKESNPPTSLDKSTLRWKTPLDIGHSSPCIWDDNIYLTSFIEDQKELKTICIDRNTGNIKWQRSIFPEKIEKYQAISNAAQTTPVADENGVYVYFGSYGILHYDAVGNLIWDFKIPVSGNKWGVTSSPILFDDLLIISRDIRKDQFLLALDKKRGKEIWKTELHQFEAPYSNGSATPVRYENSLVIHQIGGIASYSIADGSVDWFLPTLTSGSSTPIIDGKFVYTCLWHNYSDEENRGDLPKYKEFSSLLKEFDADENGLVSKEEFPDDLYMDIRPEIADVPNASHKVEEWFGYFDKDKDGSFNKEEWDSLIAGESKYYVAAGLVGMDLSSKGELAESDFIWRVEEKVPEVPAPIVWGSNIYMIKNGGIITCSSLESGQVHYRERLGASGPYIASPVGANGNIYVPATKGIVTVIKAGDKLDIIAQNDLKEKIYATPAIIKDTIYIRTTNHLYAFGQN